jgi:hypothetical protein
MTPVLAYYTSGQDWLILALVALVIFPFSSIFWIVELVDAIRRQFDEPNLKVVWVLVILFGHFLGALLYYAIGKKQGVLLSENGIPRP